MTLSAQELRVRAEYGQRVHDQGICDKCGILTRDPGWAGLPHDHCGGTIVSIAEVLNAAPAPPVTPAMTREELRAKVVEIRGKGYEPNTVCGRCGATYSAGSKVGQLHCSHPDGVGHLLSVADLMAPPALSREAVLDRARSLYSSAYICERCGHAGTTSPIGGHHDCPGTVTRIADLLAAAQLAELQDLMPSAWSSQAYAELKRAYGQGHGLNLGMERNGDRYQSRINGPAGDGFWLSVWHDSPERARLELITILRSKRDHIVTPKDPTPMTDTKRPILKTLEVDATEAAWRMAGSQFVKLAKEPIVALLSRHLGPDDESLRGRIAAFLDTELGAAILSGVLSAGLSAMPLPPNDVSQRLSRELRVRSMATAGDAIAEVLVGPLRQVACTYLQGQPPAQQEPAQLVEALRVGTTSATETVAEPVR